MIIESVILCNISSFRWGLYFLALIFLPLQTKPLSDFKISKRQQVLHLSPSCYIPAISSLQPATSNLQRLTEVRVNSWWSDILELQGKLLHLLIALCLEGTSVCLHTPHPHTHMRVLIFPDPLAQSLKSANQFSHQQLWCVWVDEHTFLLWKLACTFFLVSKI